MTNRIKQLRIEKNLTQEQLGKVLNVSGRSVGFYESGDRDPDTTTLGKLADYFNVSIDYLLGRVDDPENKIVPKEGLPNELAKYVDYIEIIKDAEIEDISPKELKEIIEFAKKIKDKSK